MRHCTCDHIVADIKRTNAKHKSNKLTDRGFQSFMYTMLANSSHFAARLSVTGHNGMSFGIMHQLCIRGQGCLFLSMQSLE
ncbi:protein SDA1 homolog isoform X4 [Halichondria panicea]|uniref:protein SDA1 homolog isoform X4 n=1 Tax=Halichondria panicea TaxID=6063 RepID=UPI00312B9CF8